MAYDAHLADRLRTAFATVGERAVEKRMFGGIAFMVNGHMTCGLNGDRLMVRVGKDAHDDAAKLPHTRPMDFTGRPMRGYLFVDPEGFDDEADLDAWVARCLAHTKTLPPK